MDKIIVGSGFLMLIFKYKRNFGESTQHAGFCSESLKKNLYEWYDKIEDES